MKIIGMITVLLLTVAVQADVKTEEKSQMKFEGMMGRMMGLFGGGKAAEGMMNTVAVKGNRKMTVNEHTGQIVDLDEEKVYELDMRGRSYRVTTFEEMRRRMQEAREKAAQASSRRSESRGGEKADQQMEVDFSLKESGQKKNINGFDCREVVMTITVRQKGKTLEDGGDAVMTSNIWLAPTIAAMNEVAEFDRRYAAKLNAGVGLGASAEQMAMAMAMYPGMKEAMGKFQAENVNMKGTPILTVMTMQGAVNPQQQRGAESPESNSSSSAPTSIRGLGGLIGRRAARKKAEPESAEAAPATPGRPTIFTMNHELIRVSNTVTPTDLAIPAGFKEKR